VDRSRSAGTDLPAPGMISRWGSCLSASTKTDTSRFRSSCRSSAPRSLRLVHPPTIIEISSAFDAPARSDVRSSILSLERLHILGVIPAKPA